LLEITPSPRTTCTEAPTQDPPDPNQSKSGDGRPAPPQRGDFQMKKTFAIGFAALIAAASVAATTAPAASKHKHHGHHHGHHGHHGGHWGGGYWGGGLVFDIAPLVIDQPDPVYCVDRRGRLYVCAYN
jgi:hypothetical protein